MKEIFFERGFILANPIADMIKNNAAQNDMCVNWLMTAKYFERIGDHSKNICEWIEFSATGEYKHKIIL